MSEEKMNPFYWLQRMGDSPSMLHFIMSLFDEQKPGASQAGPSSMEGFLPEQAPPVYNKAQPAQTAPPQAPVFTPQTQNIPPPYPMSPKGNLGEVLGVEYGPVELFDKKGKRIGTSAGPFQSLVPQLREESRAAEGAAQPTPPVSAPQRAGVSVTGKEARTGKPYKMEDWQHDKRWGEWQQDEMRDWEGKPMEVTSPMGTFDEFFAAKLPTTIQTVGDLALRIDPEAWDRFINEAPKSENIEDRRPEAEVSTMQMFRDFWREMFTAGPTAGAPGLVQRGSVVPFPGQTRPTSGRPTGAEVFEGAKQMGKPGSNVVPHPSREGYQKRAKDRLDDPYERGNIMYMSLPGGERNNARPGRAQGEASGGTALPKNLEDALYSWSKKETSATSVKKMFRDNGWDIDLRKGGGTGVEIVDPSGRYMWVHP